MQHDYAYIQFLWDINMFAYLETLGQINTYLRHLLQCNPRFP